MAGVLEGLILISVPGYPGTSAWFDIMNNHAARTAQLNVAGAALNSGWDAYSAADLDLVVSRRVNMAS